MERKHLVQQLVGLPLAEFVDVMREVFEARAETSERKGLDRKRLFMCYAQSMRLSDRGEPQRWDTWSWRAVAYPDSRKYANSLAYGDVLCEDGMCPSCGVDVCGTVKWGACPVCGGDVGMT